MKEKGSTYRSYEDKLVIIRKKYFPKLNRIGLRKNSRVLDIGCAFGYFLKCCDEMEYQTYGVDVSDYAISRARKETMASLYVCDANKGLPFFQDNWFDLVTMFDIIEHLRTPNAVLNEVHRVLKASGVLVVTTPNFDAVERLLKKIIGMEDTWHGFKDETHLRVFSARSLKLLVEQNSFCAEVETVFHPLPKILQRWANKTGRGGQIWLTAKPS